MRTIRTILSLMFIGFLGIVPGYADYEIYRSDGFEKVHEIVEKKGNPDGTYTVRARKTKNSDEIVTIEKVVEIKDVAAKTGPKYMEREDPAAVPTATPVPVVTAAPKSDSADVPWVRNMSKTVVGVVIGIVAAFVILFIWVKSSN